MPIYIEGAVVQSLVKITDEIFDIYTVNLEGNSLNFCRSSHIKVDRDGDFVVNIDVEESDLVEHVSPDAMITFLEENGYTVIENG